MKRIFSTVAVVLALTAVLASAQDRESRQRPELFGDRAEFLGERTVDFRAEDDTIAVGFDKGMFRNMGFEVEDNDIEIYRIVVDYRFGGRRAIETNLFFREGSRSGMVDLDGGRRWVRSVRFYYRTIGPLREGRATVRLYGIH
jgi:hypothetical protein